MGNYEIESAKPAPPEETRILVDTLWRNATDCIQREEYDKANKYLAEALAMVPEHDGCLAALAVCLAESQHKYKSAEKLARRAIRLAPRHAHGYHAIGRIYVLSGKLAQARDNLRRANLLDPTDPLIKRDLDSLERQRKQVFQDKLGLPAVIMGARKTWGIMQRDRIMVLMICMMLTTVVGISMLLFDRTVMDRELALAQFENQKARHMFTRAHQQAMVKQIMPMKSSIMKMEI